MTHETAPAGGTVPDAAPFPAIEPDDIVVIRAAGGAWSGRDCRQLKRDVLLDVSSVRRQAGPGEPRLELYGYVLGPSGAYSCEGELGVRMRTLVVAPDAVAEVRPALRRHDRAVLVRTGELVTVLDRFADEETGTRMCTVTGPDEAVRTVREYALRLAELDPGEMPHSAPGVLPDVRTGDLLSLAASGGVYNAHWFPVRTPFGLEVSWAAPVTNAWGTFVRVSGTVLDMNGVPVGGGRNRRHTDVYVTAEGLAEHRRPLDRYEEVTDQHGTPLLVWAVGLGLESGARACRVIDVARARPLGPLRPEWSLRRVGDERPRTWSPEIAPGDEVRIRRGWDADGSRKAGDWLPPFVLRVRHVAPHERNGREWLHLSGELVDQGDGTPLDVLRERVARGVLVLPHGIER